MNTIFNPEDVSILNESWLHGKYKHGEINTWLHYLCYEQGDFNYYSQGDEAEQVIKQIHEIWLNGLELTTEQAFEQYFSNF